MAHLLDSWQRVLGGATKDKTRAPQKNDPILSVKSLAAEYISSRTAARKDFDKIVNEKKKCSDQAYEREEPLDC